MAHLIMSHRGFLSLSAVRACIWAGGIARNWNAGFETK